MCEIVKKHSVRRISMRDATCRIVPVTFFVRLLPAPQWAAVVFCLSLCLLGGRAEAAAPQRFVLAPPALEAAGGTLNAACSVSVNDEDGLRDMLKDGAVLELRITFEVDRERSWWKNSEIASGVFASGLRHDPLTREFVLTIPVDGRATIHKDRNLNRLLQSTWQAIRFPLVPEAVFREHDADQTYRISLAFELRHVESPPWLEKSPGFWSSDVVPQERRELQYPF